MGDISPISRDEKLLRKLLGQSIQTEPPQSRIEVLLQQIIDGGGVGGSYKIKDAYATLADLQAAHPTGAAGDAYLVGDPAHVYVWAEDASAWEDGGAFSAIAGPAGNGIKSIAKTATVGLVDTYTITFDDDTTETFNVTNGEDGVGIVSINKTASVGLVDTYTITLTNGTTYDFTVTNGSGGSGVPEGGTTGQVLAKKSDADGDVGWVDQSDGSDVSSEIASLSASASEAASEIASLSTENSTQSSELSSLSSENSLQTSEIGSLSAASSELASEMASTSTSQSEIDSTQNVALGSLSAENSTQTSELGSLSTSMSELASAASSTSTAQSEIDSNQNVGLASLSTENSTQTSEISSLSTENSTQTSEIDSLSTAASELGSQVESLGSEVADKQDVLVEGPGIDIDPSTNEIKTEVNIFTGTLEAWKALTLAEKIKYTHAVITNDTQSGIIDLVPTENSVHAVASGGVYDKLEETAKLNTSNILDATQSIKVDNIDIEDTPASATWGNNGIQYLDKDGNVVAYITTLQNTDGSIDFKIDTNGALAHVGKVRINGESFEASGVMTTPTTLALNTPFTAPHNGYLHISITASTNPAWITFTVNGITSTITAIAGEGSMYMLYVPKGSVIVHTVNGGTGTGVVNYYPLY